MRISTHILPRRVILAVLVLLGLLLRMWGLNWGDTDLNHPGEWTWRIIESLSEGNLTYADIWTLSFFSLASLARWLMSVCLAWLELLVGQVRAASEVAVSSLLAGRLTVAWLGTLQIWAAYMAARRYFDSVATGLLAAAFIAVSPLLVVQSHYLTLDIPLGLMFIFCWWMARLIIDQPSRKVMLGAGLILGLTITTKASGLLAGPFLLAAYILSRLYNHFSWRQALLVYPLYLGGGLLLGLSLGYPGLWLNFFQTMDVVRASLIWPPLLSAEDWSSVWLRWQALGQGLTLVGWVLPPLWLLAMIILGCRRRWDRLIIALFPLVYVILSLTLLTGSAQGQIAIWLPSLAMVGVWPLVLLCRRLPGRWWPAGGAAILGLLLCFFPLWRSLALGYLFWQQDTMEAARFWLHSHKIIHEQVRLAYPLPLYLLPGSKRWDPAETGSRQLLYVLTEDGHTDSFVRNMRLLQEFSQPLDPEGYPQIQAGQLLGITPSLKLWVNLPPAEIKNPLALYRPRSNSEQSYAQLFGYRNDYSLDNGGMWLVDGGVRQRILRHDANISGLGLSINNFGADVAEVRISQGPARRTINLYPGQLENLLLSPMVWPPMLRESYPVKITVSPGQRLSGHLSWDPLLLGRQALESGNLEQAAKFLELAVEQRGGFDAAVLWAGTLARLGRYEQAGRVLDGLADQAGEPAKTYLDLAAQTAPDPQWRQRFQDLTGYYWELLEQSLNVTCRIKSAQYSLEGPESRWAGEGFEASFSPSEDALKNQLRIWPNSRFPAGHWLVVLRMPGRDLPRTQEKLAHLEVWAHHARGAELIAGQTITSVQLSGNADSPVVLPVEITYPEVRLEIRINYLSEREPALDELSIEQDLPAHMRQMLRWYYEAWGRVSLQSKHFETAITSFETLLDLEPDYREVFLPLGKALLDAGRPQKAREWAAKAEAVYHSFPAQLAEVHALYQLLNQTEDAARVEARLSALRPSLRRMARFAGGVTLLGYDLAQENLKPGGELSLNYYWQVWAKPPLNYYIFVHLKKTDYILPMDHPLDHGKILMPELQIGQVVREDYRIQLPSRLPPGRYQLLLGLWDPNFSRQRERIVEGEDAGRDEVLLTTLDVR